MCVKKEFWLYDSFKEKLKWKLLKKSAFLKHRFHDWKKVRWIESKNSYNFIQLEKSQKNKGKPHAPSLVFLRCK